MKLWSCFRCEKIIYDVGSWDVSFGGRTGLLFSQVKYVSGFVWCLVIAAWANIDHTNSVTEVIFKQVA